MISALGGEALHAAIVTFEFDGMVTSAPTSPIWFAGVGDVFSGTFSYDTDTPNTADGRIPTYSYPTVDSPIEFQVSIAGNVFTARNLTYTETTFSGIPNVNLGIFTDSVTAKNPVSPTLGRMEVLLADYDGLAHFGFSDPFGHTRSFDDLSTFEDASIVFVGANTNSPRITGQITGLRLATTETVIPEPSALLVWCFFIACAFSAVLCSARHRLSTHAVELAPHHRRT